MYLALYSCFNNRGDNISKVTIANHIKVSVFGERGKPEYPGKISSCCHWSKPNTSTMDFVHNDSILINQSIRRMTKTTPLSPLCRDTHYTENKDHNCNARQEGVRSLVQGNSAITGTCLEHRRSDLTHGPNH